MCLNLNLNKFHHNLPVYALYIHRRINVINIEVRMH